MTEEQVLEAIRGHVTEIRGRCERLQRLEARRKGKGMAELRRMAGEPDEGIVFDLCRLLFRARDSGAFRQRWSILWERVGGAKAADCPREPFHVFQGVPFHLGIGVRLMGIQESASDYLSYCLEAGVWESEPYRQGGRDELLAAASGLMDRGPWSRPLHPYERGWLLAQVPSE